MDNRWNVAGEPTLYLASDRGVVFAEYGRHFEEDRAGGGLLPRRKKRVVYRFDVALDRVLDLRDIQACSALVGQTDPHWYEDIAFARKVSRRLRQNLVVQALRVRTVPFPEPRHLDRWILVLFLENLPADTSRYVRSVVRIESF